MLIWSGASFVDQRTVLDFRVTSYNGSPHLSFIIQRANRHDQFPLGAGLILNNSYSLQAKVNGDGDGGNINMHEFNVIKGGQSALLIATGKMLENTTVYNNTSLVGAKTDIPLDVMFREVEIASGKILFNWRAANHVGLSESTVSVDIALKDYL